MSDFGVPAGQRRRAPGRPRSVLAHGAIIEAVLALLSEGTTLEALSVEAVAARAGVGKATIYRRWPGKEALVVDAIATLKIPLPGTGSGSVRADLVALLRTVGAVPDQRADRILCCLAPDLVRDGQFFRLYQKMMEPRREAMRQVLRRGMAMGELRADLDVEIVLAALSGPVVLQRMFRWNPALDLDDLPERLVDLVLAGTRVEGDGQAGTRVEGDGQASSG